MAISESSLCLLCIMNKTREWNQASNFTAAIAANAPLTGRWAHGKINLITANNCRALFLPTYKLAHRPNTQIFLVDTLPKLPIHTFFFTRCKPFFNTFIVQSENDPGKHEVLVQLLFAGIHRTRSVYMLAYLFNNSLEITAWNGQGSFAFTFCF